MLKSAGCSMADTPETLFFLEVFVEYVQLDDTRVRKEKRVKPVVGLRFLDFPTLLIYPSENHQPSSTPGSDQRTSSSSSSSEEESATFSFKKGKSCLFKTSLDALHTHLSNTPLYTMLLHVGDDDIPKLLGSSLMSLSKLTASIKRDVEKRGIETPAAYGESKVGCLLNLMGERIGTISFACKLVSLAASLIPEISEPKLDKSMNITTKVSMAERSPNNDMSMDEVQPPRPGNCGVISTDVGLQQPLCTDGHPMLSQTSETSETSETKQLRCVSSACTQTEKHKKKKYRDSVEPSWTSDGDQKLCNTFCPPPLFYSSSRKDQHHLAAERYEMVNTAAECFKMMDLKTTDGDNNEAHRMEHDHQIQEEPRRTKKGGLLQNPGTLRSQSEATVLKDDAVRQLPLLSALLVELSHLNGQLQEPSSVGLTSDLRPQTTVLQSVLSSLVQEPLQPLARRSSVDECTGRNTQRNHRYVPSNSCTSPLISTNKRPAVGRSHQEMSSFPKQKLRYGLTHSFHLRLKQNKPGLTRRHQCMETFNTKQVEPQTKQAKSVKLKKQEHISSDRQSFCRGSKDVRCGEIVEMDCEGPETRLSHSQNKSDYSISSESSMKNDLSHDRSVLGQYFDHSTQDNEKNPPYLVNNSTPEDIRRSSNGRSDVGNAKPYRSSSRQSGSSSDSDSLDPCKYQDDFTSLDSNDESPNPLSSPEPHPPSRPQKTQWFSSSDSSSSGSSSSGNSVHRAYPVPVKTQLSPKHSLKGTRVIKLQTSIHSDSTSASLSSYGVKSRTSIRPPRNSESYSSVPESPTVSRNLESPKSDQANDSTPKKEQFVNKFQASDDFMLKSVSSDNPEEEDEVELDELGSLGFQNKYLPISELVVNQLPGYTL